MCGSDGSRLHAQAVQVQPRRGAVGQLDAQAAAGLHHLVDALVHVRGDLGNVHDAVEGLDLDGVRDVQELHQVPDGAVRDDAAQRRVQRDRRDGAEAAAGVAEEVEADLVTMRDLGQGLLVDPALEGEVLLLQLLELRPVSGDVPRVGPFDVWLEVEGARNDVGKAVDCGASVSSARRTHLGSASPR
ncbi:tRNA pseudouridine(55) synthase TruB [Babesia caballi]|uniref:tRNA pseudouridine(55) synthase TruB n=1 Tax=Babesia caballi TaxID=5871 RepID=A0AAV4LPS6_BABCB|nr:tRNA pseudouridine(55) synthase TruB [Babesia caballi]